MIQYLRDPENPDARLTLQAHQCPFVLDMTAEEIFGSGGWGSGKSYALIQKIALLCSQNPPGTKGIVVLPTGPLLSKFIRNYFKPAFSEYIVKFNKTELVAEMPAGREIYFISAFEWERIQVITAAWAAGDEIGLWDEEAYLHIVGRVRDRRALFPQKAFTGVAYYHPWIVEKFAVDTDRCRRYRMRTTDNKMVLPGYTDSIIASCPAGQVDCYINGDFVQPGGTVYPEWSEDRHLIDWPESRQFFTFAVYDWSPRTPHVLIFQLPDVSFMGPAGMVNKLRPGHRGTAMVLVDELVLDGSNPLTVERICMLTRERGWPLAEFVCDPAGLSAEATSGIDQIRKAKEILGIHARYATDPARRSVRNGIEHMRTLLDPAIDHIPRFYVSRKVHERAQSLPKHLKNRAFTAAIRIYSYPENKDRRPVSSDPVKDGISDHAMDCGRYGAVWYMPIARLMANAVKAA